MRRFEDRHQRDRTATQDDSHPGHPGGGGSHPSAAGSAFGKRAVLVVAVVLAPCTAAVALEAGADPAKGAPGFAVPQHVIASGGDHSDGGVFALTGTLGQADADPLQPSSGGAFAITGGFWPGSATLPPGDSIFTNGFES